MSKYQESLRRIKKYCLYWAVSIDKGSLLDEDFNTLQELIDKTTICGLPLEEAIPVIMMYRELKHTTHQLDPVEDLMMGTKGQFYYDGKSIQQILDLHDIDYVVIAKQNQDLQKLEKALDKSLDMYFRKGTYLFPSKKALKEYLLKESDKQ